MKNLKDAIYEKLDINDVNLKDKFPINKSLTEISVFLMHQNFVLCLQKRGMTQKEILNKEKDKCFILYNDTLYFADTTKNTIGPKNYMYEISEYTNKRTYKILANKDDISDEVNEYVFLKFVNKQFEF